MLILNPQPLSSDYGNNDEKIVLRLDYAKGFAEDENTYSRLNLQINKKAEKPTLTDLPNKNPHEIWPHANVLIEVKKLEPSIAAVCDATDRELSITSRSSGQEASTRAGLVELESSVKQDLVKVKVLEIFEDLKANVKG